MKSNNRNKTIKTAFTALGYFAVIFFIFFFIFKNQEPKKENPKNKFSKGVLAVNTNKSNYEPNEKVIFGMASLDQNGDTLCDSNLELVIRGPEGKETKMTSKDGEILKMNSCDESNNVTSNPDYTANLFPAEEGVYKVKLVNLENGNERETQFEVKKDLDFSIERDGATRINPFATDRYHMILRVTAKKDFKGKIVEKVPESFNIVWQGKSVVETEGDIKKITWEVDLKDGETKELIYEYQAPTVSPDFYELGKAQILEDGKNIFEEIKNWQIASDTTGFVGYTSYDNRGTTSTHTANKPTGIEQNDIMFARISMYGTRLISGTPAGWSLLTSSTANTDKYYLYYKMAGSSEPSTYTWNATGNVDASITIAAYRGGFDLTDPIDTFSNTTYRTSDTAVQAGSMTVTYPQSPLLFFGSVYTTTTISFTPPTVPSSSWVEDIDYWNDDSDFGRSIDSLIWSSSGTTGAITAYGTLSTTTKHAFAVALNPPILTITGTVYTDEAKTTNIGAGKTVSLYVNNTYKGSDDTDSNGYYSFPDSYGIGQGDTIIVYLDDETENGSTVTALSGSSDVTADIITDRTILQEDQSQPITNEDIDKVDAVDSTDEDGLTVSSGNLTVASGFELFIPSGQTYEPDGNVTTPKLHIKGTYEGTYETLTLTGSGTGACNASQTLTLPFCIDSGGAYNSSSNITKFTGTADSYIQGNGYYNLSLEPTISTSVTYTFTGASTIDGDFTINPTSSGSNILTVNLGGNITVTFPGTTTISGTTSALSILDTTSGGNYSLSTGFLIIRAAGTLEARGSTITLTGSDYTAQKQYFTASQWTASQGVSSITVKAWGAGGGGGGGGTQGSGGGGGGEYRSSVVSVVAGSSYSITVGMGGQGGLLTNGANGGDSSFGSSVVAKGGLGGTFEGAGGTGGTGGTGTTGYSGGSGASGLPQEGGGGGEGAGTTANGTTATSQTGATGTDGGDGGNGGSRDVDGSPGGIPGGGGGGGGRSFTRSTLGGDGYRGQVILEYSVSEAIFTRVGTFNAGTSTVVYSQSRGNTTLNSGTISFYNMELNTPGYTGDLGNAITIQHNLTITAGTLDDAGNQITGNATGTLTAGSGTYLKLGGTSSGTSFPTLFINANINLNIDSTVVYQAGVGQTISGVPTYGDIVIYSNGTISDSTVNVHGDWTCTGTLTPGTSTVYLNGSGNQTVTGNSNFYNFNVTTATAKTVTFTQDTIIYILSGGTATFAGASGNILTLTSSSTGPWYLRIDPSANYSISYVNVSESNAGGYKTIYANNGTVVDGGLNINWVFAAPGTEILMNFNGVNLSGVDINR